METSRKINLPETEKVPHLNRRETIRNLCRKSIAKIVRKTDGADYCIDKFTTVVFQGRYSPISGLYVLYKYVHAAVVLAILGWNLSHLADDEELKWHLYMNHWSSVICSAEAICGVFVVNFYYHQCRTKAMRDAKVMTSKVVSRLTFYTYLNATAVTFSTCASIFFWAFIYDDHVYTFVRSIEHASIPVFMIVKVYLENTPFELLHVFYPLLLLLCYFADVVAYYFLMFRESFLKGKIKLYIFKQFNDQSYIYFFWFILEACLFLSAAHVLLVLITKSKKLCLGRLFFRNRLFVHSTISQERRSELRSEYLSNIIKPTTLMTIKDAEGDETIARLNKRRGWRILVKVILLERMNRHDYIHPEWVHQTSEKPLFLYLVYRFVHMLLYLLIIFFSFVEPDRTNEMNHDVKYFILWFFYFANFFLCVSLLQSIFGFYIILGHYRRRRDEIKYFQKSERYVTGFQKSYTAIHSMATALAVFSFATAWLLQSDTGGDFNSLDYRYESSHVVNPLAMILDFLIVGHPFKFIYLLLEIFVLLLNVVFNYWLFYSRISTRTGKKLVYDFLNWKEFPQAFINVLILVAILVIIHIVLWTLFLCKRLYSIATKQRRFGEQQKYKMLREMSLGSVQLFVFPANGLTSRQLLNDVEESTLPKAHPSVTSSLKEKSLKRIFGPTQAGRQGQTSFETRVIPTVASESIETEGVSKESSEVMITNLSGIAPHKRLENQEGTGRLENHPDFAFDRPGSAREKSYVPKSDTNGPKAPMSANPTSSSSKSGGQ